MIARSNVCRKGNKHMMSGQSIHVFINDGYCQLQLAKIKYTRATSCQSVQVKSTLSQQ